MENRIKEQKALYADRTSTHEIYSNQTQIYISAVAYMLLSALRRLGLQRTELAKARSPTIRAKLLKINNSASEEAEQEAIADEFRGEEKPEEVVYRGVGTAVADKEIDASLERATKENMKIVAEAARGAYARNKRKKKRK